ncbi:MAG: type I methionyl aminopeptidase [Bacilli bacterium]|nr:type I methionyl aminopeptidase [Bacilli bacterium]
MIIVKSSREIELMKEAGNVVALVFEECRKMLKSGVTTLEIDQKAEEVIRSHGCIPTFKGYGGFPGSICISVNDTLIHGIPSNKIVLKDGDIVSLDVGATYQGYCGDACRTYPVGQVTEKASRLMKVTEESFYEGCKQIHPGAHLGDISHAIQEYNESHGYSLPRDYTGHGIGQHLHEDPSIPNVGKAGTGPILQVGMCLAIEPMVAEGKPFTRVLNDEWTVKMKDGKLSSHYENTVVVTETGYEILTKLKEK